MKKRNITTGLIESATNSKSETLLTGGGETICVIPRHNSSEGNKYLIIDAFQVANQTGFTPTMLMEERQTLLDNAKFTHEEMAKVINSDLSFADIVSQHKLFKGYLKEAKAKLIYLNSDPIGGEFDEKCNDYDFIKLLDTLITNP